MARDKICTPFLALASPENKFTVNTIEDMQSRKYLKVGDVVELNGYYTAGDGAGHKRKIEATDDGSGVQLANGLWGNIIKGTETYSVNTFIEDIKTYKYRDNSTDYYITNIPKIYKLHLGLANDILNTVESNLDFSKRKNATLSINAGLFDTVTNNTKGIVIKDGIILSSTSIVETVSEELLCIDSNGNLSSTPSNTANANELIKNGILNAVQGWYPIIRNGIEIGGRDPKNKLPLQIIAQKNDKNYIIFTCDGRTEYDVGMSTSEACSILLKEGVDFAYMLDSGGSTSITNKAIKQNKNIDNLTDDRKVANFLYFSKFDNYTLQMFDVMSEIALIKQELNLKITNIENIERGLLKLKPKSLNVPGLEIYDREITRSAKLGFDTSTGSIFLDGTSNGKYKNLFKFENDSFYLFNKKSANFFGELDLVEGKIDSITLSGIYRCNNLTTDKPQQVATNDYGSVLCMKHGVSERGFIDLYFSKTPENKMFIRQRYGNGTSAWGEIQILTTVYQKLDTPYHTLKMQQEGVYEDFIQYMDEKTEYDRVQRESENQPEGVMLLPVIEEPQPSEALLKFKEKYLG